MKTAFIDASLANTLFTSVSVVTKAPMEECGSPLARKVFITMFVADSRRGRHGPVKPDSGATASP